MFSSCNDVNSLCFAVHKNHSRICFATISVCCVVVVGVVVVGVVVEVDEDVGPDVWGLTIALPLLPLLLLIRIRDVVLFMMSRPVVGVVVLVVAIPIESGGGKSKLQELLDVTLVDTA